MDPNDVPVVQAWTVWRAPGVVRVIGTGGSVVIGLCSDNTVLKYTHNPYTTDPFELESLDIEAQLYQIIGEHPRILKFLGGNARVGLRLEYAENGSLANFLASNNNNNDAKNSQRLKWCLQSAEALAHVHSKNVLHRDVNTTNILLDKNLDVKLADMQGTYVSPNGQVVVDGEICENTKSAMPRPDPCSGSVLTDLFALGSALYYIIKGHEPYPELDSWKDEEEIVSRFKAGQFPTVDPALGGEVIRKCWEGGYQSAQELVVDLEKLLRDYPEEES